MSGSFSKEQRRNLVKAVGSTAFDAMEQARQLAFLTETRAAAMAKEFLNFEKTTRETVDRQDAQLKQLENRCTGLGQWCGTNEAQADQVLRELGTLKGRLDATEAEVRILQSQRRLDVREHGRLFDEFTALRHAGFWQRLQWLLTGRLPAVPELRAGDLSGKTIRFDPDADPMVTFGGITTALDTEVHKNLAWPMAGYEGDDGTVTQRPDYLGIPRHGHSALGDLAEDLEESRLP